MCVCVCVCAVFSSVKWHSLQDFLNKANGPYDLLALPSIFDAQQLLRYVLEYVLE